MFLRLSLSMFLLNPTRSIPATCLIQTGLHAHTNTPTETTTPSPQYSADRFMPGSQEPRVRVTEEY